MGSNHNCSAVITLYSALKKYDNYYLQVFLKECKYIEKEVIIHDFSSDDDDNESDEEELFENVFFERAILYLIQTL